MPRYSLIIFDFDGTLADSAKWVIRTLNENAARFGMRTVSDAEVQMLRGRSNRDIIRYLGVPLWRVPQIAADMRRRVGQEAEQIKLFDGVDDLLRTLKASGVRIAIVSSNDEANVRRILGAENTALIDLFDCSASMFGKSHKIRSVLSRAAVAPRDAVCIGDETRDIEAAKDARIDSGAVVWGYANAEILERFKPTLMFRTLAEIAALAG